MEAECSESTARTDVMAWMKTSSCRYRSHNHMPTNPSTSQVPMVSAIALVPRERFTSVFYVHIRVVYCRRVSVANRSGSLRNMFNWTQRSTDTYPENY